MSLSQMKCCLIIPLLCLSIFTTLSASPFVSDIAFGLQVSNQRRLLQVAKHCPINFEFQNYTIITSKCKGPDLEPKPCCSAFKEFACQFVDEIDDLTNDCATIMFNYINLNGKYPPGLFASLCREGKEGLVCPDPPDSLSDERLKIRKNGGHRMISEALIVVGSLVLSLQLV